MKLEKLMTLSQFVNHIRNRDYFDCDALSYIYHYDVFLNKSLSKEMFVNEIEMPKRKYGIKKGQMYNPKFIAWQEAEKKVIFKGFQLKDNSINYKDVIHVFWFDTITQLWKLSNGLETINGLAFLMYSGELELKNVEL